MVLCPPFRWSTKGGFNVSTAKPTTYVGPRDSYRISVNDATTTIVPNGEATNGGTKVPIDTRLLSISQAQDVSSRNTSTSMSVQSVVSSSYSKPDSDNDRNMDISVERKSSARHSGPRRKTGIIAPHVPDTDLPIQEIRYPKFPKDEKQMEQIKKAVMANDFLKNLMDEARLNAVVEAMNSQEFPPGGLIIKEGESGSHLYVSAYGEFEVVKGGQIVKTFGPGEAFGELAILYKAKRFANIRCTTDSKVWTLERRVFQKIMARSGRQEHEDNIRFLASVPLLRDVHVIELSKISEFLKREFFSSGTPIVRQGDPGNKFYIIRGGTVLVSKRDGDQTKLVSTLGPGDFFGEQALLNEHRRLATCVAQASGAECLTLDRGPFTKLLGNLKKLKEIVHTPPRISQQKKDSKVVSEFNFVKLEELEIVGTMGVGGFGRVELVQYRPAPALTFALKCLKKVDMVQQQQQEHAFNEKHIMMSCNSPFICRLYNTYKNDKYLYFLMEPVLGGDVWTILQKQRYFPDHTARFMAACVVEAFAYLHKKDIVYRDLKPENLMLDKEGYIKLVDFGFAKQIPTNSKTWTFAGTPEYVAPEIVLAKGHDRAVDCWALGIFIHELLVGKPPFRAPGGDHMKTYTLILRGIDAVAFKPTIAKSAQMLIRKLCRAVPAERLGYLKNGMSDVKNHKWFLGFDWEGLRERRLKPPLVQPVASDTDLSNFESYPRDTKVPPDETSGWDMDF